MVMVAGTSRFRLTVIVPGLLDAPGQVTVMDPLCPPAGRPAMFTEMMRLTAGSVDANPGPAVGVTLSQGSFENAVQFRVPVPALVSNTVCDPGVVPPTKALNVRLVGLKPIAGVVRTFSSTEICTETLEESGSLIVMVPLFAPFV